MTAAIVTGSAGLIGSETVRFLAGKGFLTVGVDNNMRKEFFGPEASTEWRRRELEAQIANYQHRDVDIRDQPAIEAIFSEFGSDLELIVHAAAQPSHDWAAGDPRTDFTVNANGTLVLLEATRKYCPQARFIFTSTNKVYGSNPNQLPLDESESRWELEVQHPFYEHGIDETMSVDRTMHSLFGVSKLAADALVQEYGRYFGMNTVCFRCGCLTGPGHSGAMFHGFLSYLMKCAVAGDHYTIFGYQGKQVRDNLHSYDLVNMFWHYYLNPRPGEIYNAGGGRDRACSVLEAIALCEKTCGNSLNVSYSDENRVGDHIWYISDTRRFRRHFPDWDYSYNLQQTAEEIHRSVCGRQENR